MATTKELYNQLLNAIQTGGYQQKTQDAIMQQAQNEYAPLYEQQRLSARQAYEQSDLALQKQLAGLQDTYDRQREDTAKSYRAAYSQLDRGMMGRGMQRSSYNAQMLANLSQQGLEAQGDIDRAQATAEGNIGQQRTQLARQLMNQLSAYDTQQSQQVLGRVQGLTDQEYEREQAEKQTTFNQLLQAIQLGKSIGSIGGGGGGGYSSVPSGSSVQDTNPVGTNTSDANQSLLTDFNKLVQEGYVNNGSGSTSRVETGQQASTQNVSSSSKYTGMPINPAIWPATKPNATGTPRDPVKWPAKSTSGSSTTKPKVTWSMLTRR